MAIRALINVINLIANTIIDYGYVSLSAHEVLVTTFKLLPMNM